jgi:glycine/serine hydroxymethyltransferase
MKQAEMKEIGQIIASCVLKTQSYDSLKQQVLTLTSRFPLYPEMVMAEPAFSA